MKYKGTPFMILGLLFIAAAAFLLFHNRDIDSAAQDSAQSTAAELLMAIKENSMDSPAKDAEEPISATPTTAAPDVTPLKTVTVQNVDYIGLLDIPSLNLSLPIRAECSPADLEDAPCRYAGSTDTDDLVIAGHNYNAHFGQLHNVSIGEIIYLTIADGSIHSYTVKDIEILSPYDVEEMCAGDWPLTLFTCTYGGQNRVTIRCDTTDS